jgi:hypothetical protein
MGRVSFFNRLDGAYREALTSKHNQQLASFIIQVKEWIQLGTFSKYKYAKEVLSQWGLSDTKAAENTQMSPGNIRFARSSLSNSLFSLFGSDFCDYLDHGDIQSLINAKHIFEYVKWGKSARDYIPQEMIQIIELSGCAKDFDARDCRAEYDFLKKYSIQQFKNDLNEVDKDKVLYVLKVLNGQAGVPLESYRFINDLNNLGVQDKG